MPNLDESFKVRAPIRSAYNPALPDIQLTDESHSTRMLKVAGIVLVIGWALAYIFGAG